MAKKKIKVAFDMDGVLLYNPSRIFRNLISRTKKAHLFPREELEFYHPQTQFEDWFWLLLHKSSFKLATGFRELEKMLAAGDLEIYLVSGRFPCLQSDSAKWIKKLNRKNIFKGIYLNDKDEDPHLFKERMLKELKVDYFVEDNWDVVNYLSQTFKKSKLKTEVWWISNFLDQQIDYPHKYLSFKAVVEDLKKLT
jgi:hypothetical protein